VLRAGLSSQARSAIAALFVVLTAFIPLSVRADAISPSPAHRTPVILDTDIGDDTDDCWALVYALKNPQLDVKLITTTCGKQQYRAELIAKFLTIAGRTDIPIGLGAGSDPNAQRRMQNWLGDFTLASYRGQVKRDGAGAIIDVVNASASPVTIIAIGPLNTVGAALKQNAGIAARANLAAMLGSLHVDYGNKPGQALEYNVWRDIDDARAVLAAPWQRIAITPLDTGCAVSVVGTRYYRLLAKGDALVQALLLNSALAHNVKDPAKINFGGSGFDDVAVFLAEGDPSRLAEMQKLKIVVDKHGKTNVDAAGQEMNVATSWNNLNGFLDHLVDTLLLPTSGKTQETP
jgi:inosine-uridine nucleoside N-ribohydrolase